MSSFESLVSGGTHGSTVLRRQNALLRTRIRIRSLSLAAFLRSGLSLWYDVIASSSSSTSSGACSLRLRPIIGCDTGLSDYLPVDVLVFVGLIAAYRTLYPSIADVLRRLPRKQHKVIALVPPPLQRGLPIGWKFLGPIGPTRRLIEPAPLDKGNALCGTDKIN